MTEAKLIGCPCCKGRKKILGMGCFMQTCEECKGIGWITEKVEDEKPKGKGKGKGKGRIAKDKVAEL